MEKRPCLGIDWRAQQLHVFNTDHRAGDLLSCGKRPTKDGYEMGEEGGSAI